MRKEQLKFGPEGEFFSKRHTVEGSRETRETSDSVKHFRARLTAVREDLGSGGDTNDLPGAVKSMITFFHPWERLRLPQALTALVYLDSNFTVTFNLQNGSAPRR